MRPKYTDKSWRGKSLTQFKNSETLFMNPTNKPQPDKTMKKRLTNIDPLKLGITLAVIYGVMSLIFIIPFFLIMSLVGAANARTGAQAMPVIFSGVFMIFLPIIYAVLGFIGGLIMAFIYNLVAKWTGGVEFTTQEV
jgi:Na+(H+)/acetate symporter ActP